MAKLKWVSDGWSAKRTYHHISNNGDTPNTYRIGPVFTPFGIVVAYTQSGDSPHTRLDFVHDSRVHTQCVDAGMTVRSLSIYANKFARKIVGEA